MTASIRPDRVVAMHVPPTDAQKVVASLRAANVNAGVATVPGTPIAIDQ